MSSRLPRFASVSCLFLCLGAAGTSGCGETSKITSRPTKARVGPQARTPGGIHVTSISMSPIMPSGATYTSYHLRVADVPEVEGLLAKLYAETKVNEQVSLGDYIDLKRQKDAQKIAAIRNAMPPARHWEWSMTMWEDGKNVFQFYTEPVHYSGDRVEELRQFVAARGSPWQNSPAKNPYFDADDPVKIPRPAPPASTTRKKPTAK